MLSILHDIAVSIGLFLHLLYRVLSGRTNREYIAHRTGRKIDELSNAVGRLIWFHGVSVGEVAALDPLIAAVRREKPGVPIAISTMTVTGLRTARKLAHPPDISFIYPIDVSILARRVVEKLRPAALVIVDGDFWFQMLAAARRAGVPIVVINGRLSEKSLRRHLRFPRYARTMFQGVKLVSAQSKTMAERFAPFLDPARISVDGNVKLDAFSPATPRETVGGAPGRFSVVFGSVHPSEIDSIAPAIRDVLAKHPRVQITIAPRHPDKFDESPIEGVVWVNKLGVLRDLYQSADAAYVGGTFCKIGGHNLAEPAIAGVPVIYGPHVEAQVPLHEILQAYQAAMQVQTTDELRDAMMMLIEDGELRQKMARAGERLRADSQGLAARLAARILKIANVI
ncbi:MAG TPA: glycosyltransferase N-terminal domain-containing protein [Bryobacteraceae bacterium]|nr:glycosyltransferase N-terminal domain-containing protein [Bryobacteraceae bacterium]